MSTQPSDELPESAGRPALGQILRRKGIEHVNCPVCGEENWASFADVAVNLITGRDTETGEIDDMSGSIHAMSTACVTCGHLMLFDHIVLEPVSNETADEPETGS